MLDNFRKIDLVWNNAYEKLGNVRTAQFDEKGRKLVVQVTDDGDIVDLTGVDLKLVTIDGIEVGGRNLVLDSAKKINIYNDNITGRQQLLQASAYYLNARSEQNTTYTISIRFRGTGVNAILSPHLAGTYRTGSFPVDNDFKTHSNTFTTVSIRQSLIHLYGINVESLEILWIKLEKGNKATDWTPAPEDLQFPFDLVDPSRGIYELYFPKLFVDRYTGDTKVFLELTTKDFSVTSEPFYINVFEGVK